MMHLMFDGTFDDWRRQARDALAQGYHPSHVQWCSSMDRQQRLFDDACRDTGERETRGAVQENRVTPTIPFRLSRQTLTTLESAACYRDPQRWDTFYRLIWRLSHDEPSLMEDMLDPDVRRVLQMDKQIRRDVHKMHAFIRFREMRQPETSEPRYIAWFEPAHDIVLRAAPFFVRRFPAMHWSILTPDISIHWNRQTLAQGPGMSRRDAPRDDDMESLWATYYSNIFNPARIKTHAMQAEMPKRYWVNLPEAALIQGLIRDASAESLNFAKPSHCGTSNEASVR